ncbi:MAG: adenylate/guanylate cyclase domain-containing protein [Actinomycetota bacterium]
MTCAACGAENRATARFCRECGSPLALTCPNGHAVEPGDRFCDTCGAPGGERQLPAASKQEAPTAERRLVSVLFADLVGFTAISESRDPEEVREILSEYFDRMRTAVERHGGVIEKFIGDAVVAVWGTPVAHEDDAERAVRAGLSSVDAAGQMNEQLGLPPGTLALRVGVLTGEAAVTVGATGQGMVAGDLVNTASRVQAAAPPGSVLVGEATRRASESSIAYEELDPLELKGKSEPVPVWRAMHVVAARRGARRADTMEPPWVGRDVELRMVRDLFHASAEQRRAHVVSVTGIAGIGKSRLSWEFEKYVDGLAETVLWHRGRCLAYGEGVTYWALAEMVRMRAGIAEEEDQEPALAKLRGELARRISEHDLRESVERSLAHLLGLEIGPPPGGEELYAAWRVFFECMADQHPVVLVFEDLQWADSALLDFIEHLLDWSKNSQLFILGLSRPELAERRPTWAAGKRNATTLHLEPLPDEAMDRLIRGLVPGIPDDVAERIRERAEGVPLYAVETVRMLLDRGLLARDGSTYRLTGPIETLDTPESLHALIAARLDGLSLLERRLLADASVLGKTFARPGLQALTDMSRDELEPILRSLLDKELLFVQSDPRSPERGQYGFLQALVREVTYGTLSKRDRKTRHLAAARFLESDRLVDEEEIVEVVASHYLDAYAADPSAEDAAAIKGKARDLLARAGDRAASLAAQGQAAGHFERALELTDDPLEQASFLERAGEAARAAGDVDRAQAHFERSIELFEEGRRVNDAARVSARLAEVLWDQGHIEDGLTRMERSFEVLSAREPDEDLATLAAQIGRMHFFMGDTDRSLERLDFALGVAERLFLPEVLSHALNTKALVLSMRGRTEEARALLRHALVIAQEHGATDAILRAYYNLYLEPPDEVLEYARLGLELARRLGNRQWEMNFLGRQTVLHWLHGEWDQAMAVSRPLLDPANRRAGVLGLSRALPALAHLLVNRGLTDEAEELVALREHAATSAGVIERADYFTALAMVARARSDLDVARRARDEILRIIELVGVLQEPTREGVAEAIEISLDAGEIDQAERLIEQLKGRTVAERDYLAPHVARFEPRLAAARGDHAAAEEGFQRGMGLVRRSNSPFIQAVAQLEYAEWLVQRGRAEEAEPLFVEARAVFDRLGARPWLERLAGAESALGASLPG